MIDVTIDARVVEEGGYNAAMEGLSFNKKQSPDEMHQTALKLCKQDGGHNKFLETMTICVKVRAPRFWWQEADTYRISTKQSESTMHTLVNELQTIDRENLTLYGEQNFDGGYVAFGTLETMYEIANNKEGDVGYEIYGKFGEIAQLIYLKRLMPEGFLQKRMWCMSYKTFRNMYLQRKSHRLPHWPKFLAQVLAQIEHPDLLGL